MLLGIDFDNTIVCYDALFHRVALEDGWIPASLPANKSDVRNHLRRIGREDVWTEMQGRVYGPRLAEAEPFPGVLDFLRLCRATGFEFCIISHKTRTPFAGQPHDLHQAAWNWLETRGFFNPSDIALPRSRVFLELTKQAKLQRIAACHCSAFIDDLPEFLAEPAFPTSTHRILFDPNRLYGPDIPFERLHSWLEAPNRLLPTPTPPAPPAPTPAQPHPEPPLAQVAALIPGQPTGTPRLHPVAGGRNNRVYLVEPGRGSTPYVLKQYFLNPADPRDRFAAEHAFYRWIHLQAIQRTPKPAAWDVPNRLALFHLAPGRKLLPGEPAPHHIDQAVAFIRELNSHRLTPEAASLPNASEACFAISDHLSRIHLRVERLARLQPESDIDRAALDFIHSRLQPRWSRLQTSLTSQPPDDDLHPHPLPHHHRCLSPSDFGFHNALLDDQDTLRFLDFEYAGWDDPAKLVCDFFCQPQVPVDLRFWDQVVQPLGQSLDQPSSLAARARFLLPAYRIKWCCILLNEFLATDSSRRAFADNSLATEHRKAAQLDKARHTLESLESLESLGSP